VHQPEIPSLAGNAAEFAWMKDDVFGRIAHRYDRLCDLFSLGIHRLWKRRVAQVIARESWATLLDGATGTGDIILRVLPGIAGEGRVIIASDISAKMLAVAELRLAGHHPTVALRQLDAERMPSVPSSSVDAYSISLGLKICDRSKASNIPWAPLHRIYLFYMSLCMPLLGWLATGGDASAYKYLLQGIRGFPTAEALALELGEQGFEDVAFERLSLGIVAIHTARKPGS
jgi:ubiquinone/menaquinone biosynthesis C-methylase UbiE